jgi:hypothetical protein
MVLNFLTGPGATHGWHLDDPPFAVVIFVEAPPPEQGGLLELIPNWEKVCEQLGVPPQTGVNPTVKWCQDQGLVKQFHHIAGDVYVLHAGLALHRVTELIGDNARRVVLNFAYERNPDTTYGNTASILYRDM